MQTKKERMGKVETKARVKFVWANTIVGVIAAFVAYNYDVLFFPALITLSICAINFFSL